MARYHLEVPHTPEECVADLDSILGYSREMFNRFDWGCKGGEHVGWATVEAQDPATARMLLPMVVRGKARVVSVNKFTADEVKAFHEEMAPRQGT